MLFRRFRTTDQVQAKALILNGLTEHWGEVDVALNVDLNSIGDVYGGNNTFWVAESEGQIVGTGGLVVGTAIAEVVRMSVARNYRRRGVGKEILNRLYADAQSASVERLVLETTASWSGVVQFYVNFGFELSHETDGPFGRETHFSMSLRDPNHEDSHGAVRWI